MSTEIDNFRHISPQKSTFFDIYRPKSPQKSTFFDIYRPKSPQKSTFFDIYRPKSAYISTFFDTYRQILANIDRRYRPKNVDVADGGTSFTNFWGLRRMNFWRFFIKQWNLGLQFQRNFQSIFHPFMPILWPKRVPKKVFLLFWARTISNKRP